MADGDRGRRRLVVGVVGVVLVLVAAALSAYLLQRGGEPAAAPDPTEDPAAVPAPPALALPEPAPAPPVAAPLAPGALRPGRVRRALAGLTADPRLGPRTAVAVAGLDGEPVYAEGPAALVPASTLKILTVVAALATLGPEHRFTTEVVRGGGRLTLVGGGDPLLAGRPDPAASGDPSAPERADLATLAARTAAALAERGRDRVRLSYDATLFAGAAVSPFWEDDYVPDGVVTPVTALWADEGRRSPDEPERVADPARSAALLFAAELRARGVRVAGEPTAAPAPAGAAPVAEVAGAELVEVGQHVLEWSDNEAAEVLARHVALAEGLPGSFAGAGRALPAVLARLGVDTAGTVVRDGSGLSRANRLTTTALLQTLAAAADPARPELAGALEGLPVAGWTGSLGYRFTVRADTGLGWVRAKTGTLTGVHGLAGVVTAADGALLAFVAVADRVPVQHTLFARDRLDQLAAALAGCACRR